MNKNDIITLKIEDMGIDGEGIGKIDGMTFFVKDAVIGDEIEARITKLKKNYGYARVEQIVKPSGFRTEPKCELHRRCGGCQIQAMDYAKQLEFKENKVKNNLVRLGGFDADFVDSVTEPIVGMEEPYRYRNKAQFPIGKDKDGNIIAGFYASRTHSIIPVKDCMLGVAENREILDAILSYMRECHIEPYDETTGRGLVRHALIRYGFTTKEIMVCLVVNGRKLPAQNVLVEKLQVISGMTSISININQKNTNVILGEQTETIWGQSYITDYIHLRDCTNFERTGKSNLLSYLTTVFLSGEPGTDREALQPCVRVCRTYRKGVRLGSVLRNRNHFFIPCRKSRACVWSGDRTTGDCRCKGQCKAEWIFQYRVFCWKSRGSIAGILCGA